MIFGGAGFVGSHLTEKLLSTGEYDEIRILDNLSTGVRDNLPDDDWIVNTRIVSYTDSEAFDIRMEDVVEETMSGANEIYHLASVVGVRLALEYPHACIDTAVNGTTNVVNSLRPNQKMIYVSSSSVYGRNVTNPISEDSDLLIGPMQENHWNYSWSKAAAELVCKRGILEGKDIRIVRPFNIVGPRQSPAYGMVLPNFIKLAAEGKHLPVFGDGKQTRSFMYVKAAVEALYSIMQKDHTDAFLSPTNIGNPEPITIMDLALTVLANTPDADHIDIIPYDKAFYPGFEETKDRIPDISKSISLIGNYNKTHGKSLVDIVRELKAEYAAKING